MQPFNEATSIMIVGMITVFFILFLIVLIGNTIIRLTNKYLPEAVPFVKGKKKSKPSKTNLAISAAIEIITNGKGRISSIKKI